MDVIEDFVMAVRGTFGSVEPTMYIIAARSKRLKFPRMSISGINSESLDCARALGFRACFFSSSLWLLRVFVKAGGPRLGGG